MEVQHFAMKKAVCLFLFLIVFLCLKCPEKKDNDVSQPKSLVYPFTGRNMFFGFNFLNADNVYALADFGITYFPVQYRITWYNIEQEKGVYNWTSIDNDVMWHQSFDADSMIVFTSLWNAFGEKRQQIENKLAEIMVEQNMSLNDAWIYFHRDFNGIEQYDLNPDPNDPNDERLITLLEFTKLAVERFDGDGIDDAPGLVYPIKYWHLINEFPGPGHPPLFIAQIYKEMSAAIREADPEAKIVLPGLYTGPTGRIFAFADGYIQDEEAGVRNSIKYSRETVLQDTGLAWTKAGYEAILREAADYFDVIDIHLYHEKETFLEGFLDYLMDIMAENGTSKPITISEGKHGPFKNPAGYVGPQGDNWFGPWTPAEHAEFVVKTNVMLAAKGVKRRQFGIGGGQGDGYWQGPWSVLGLIQKGTGIKNPAYYTFKLFIERAREFMNVQDVSPGGSIRVFRITTLAGTVYTAWDINGESEKYEPTDLSQVLSFQGENVKITYIVTALDVNNDPIEIPSETVLKTGVPTGLTPVFIELN